MDLLRIIQVSFKCWASAHFHTKINHYTITHHKKISLATQRLPLIHEKKRLNTSSNLSGYLPYAPWLLVEEHIPWMCINVSIYHKKKYISMDIIAWLSAMVRKTPTHWDRTLTYSTRSLRNLQLIPPVETNTSYEPYLSIVQNPSGTTLHWKKDH